jgi:hypothetical protein
VYFSQLGDLRVTQIIKFFKHLISPEISPFTNAKVCLYILGVTFHIYCLTNHPGWDWNLTRTIISSQGTDWRASPLTQMLSHFSPVLSTVVYLKLESPVWAVYLSGEPDIFDWLHLLHQLSTVQVLHVSQLLADHIAQALRSFTGEMVAEALSSLDLMYLEGHGHTPSLDKFAAVCQLSGCPITIVDRLAEFDQQLKSYIEK